MQQRSTLGLLSLALAFAACRLATADSAAAQANPVRKVITLLQSMQKKVVAEGETEKTLYEKFMCYCNGGSKELGASVQAGTAKVPAVSSDISTAEQKLSQLKSGLSEAQTSRADAKEAMAKAKAVREKEAAAYAAEKSDYETNIAAIDKAVASLEKGMSGSFLQTTTAAVLRKLAISQEMSDIDRQDLTSFLAGKQSGSYVPQSGSISGILKNMGDKMRQSLASATADEEASIKSFEALMAAKTKETGALSASIEAKTAQIGETGVNIVQMKEDLSDTQETLAQDQKLLQNLESSCKKKTAEWEERSKTRSEELVALADTIKILNDDDALELFKKTLPSAASSFVQFGKGASTLKSRALALIKGARKVSSSQHHSKLDLLALVLRGSGESSSGTFEKVLKMIDEMVDILAEEQQSDDNKKEYCEKQFDVSDDKKKVLEIKVSNEETSISVAKEGIATLIDEIKALEAGIKDLDKSVGDATAQRRQEHVDFKDLMASDSAAKELLGFAKNRLNKFYNPQLYKAPAKRELSAGGRIFENMGGDIPTTTPGGIAGTGVTVFAQVRAHLHSSASQAPPETWDAYQTKTEENTGVVAMMDLLIKDLDKEMTEAETSEKDAQADYEEMMADSAAKRTADTTSLREKGSAKAELESSLEDHKGRKMDSAKELMATMAYIKSLHVECDWLVQNFDVRKEARAGEVDSLKKAKAVLSGADFSFLQSKGRGLLRGS